MSPWPTVLKLLSFGILLLLGAFLFWQFGEDGPQPEPQPIPEILLTT